MERRWRRTLAAVAISALALGGISTMAAAPAFADDALAAEGETSTAGPSDDATGTGDTTEAEAEADVAEAPAAAGAPASDPPREDAQAPADAPAPADPPADTAPAPPVADAATLAVDASGPVAFLVPPGDEVVDKVEICHATAAHNNPYVVNEPAADGDVSGHSGHVGPIWFPGIEEAWGDIIPPFFYDDGDETPGFFPGLNWDAEGQVIYANDCEIPLEPDIDIIVTDCVAYSDDAGLLEVSLSGLDADFDYRITVSDAGGVFDTVTISDTAGDAFEAWDLPPGDYTVTVEWSIDGSPWILLASESFSISVCPELDLVVTPGDCSTGDDGTVMVLFTGLIPGESYLWEVEGEGGAYDVTDTFTATAETEEIELNDLPPGNFIAYIEWQADEPSQFPVFDWAFFVIEPCQPEITVEVTECPAPGGTGSALLTLSGLVEGVEYEVKVTDRGDADGTPYGGVHVVMGDAAGTAQLSISSLPADHEYTAWVDGVFEAVPWEEPPFVGGGGGITPIDTVELSASVDFTLKPCPLAPVVPEKPVTPAKVVPAKTLPKTGASGVGELLFGSMLLLGLGGAALVAGRRGKWGEHHVS